MTCGFVRPSRYCGQDRAAKGDPRDAPTSGGLDQEGVTSMAIRNVPPLRGAAQIAALLDSPEITGLIKDLQETRWTGRPGYPIRAMVGLALVKSVYVLPTWSRTVRLVVEHAALRAAIGDAPSVHAAYRFTGKLREHGDMLTACIDRVLSALQERLPDMGTDLAIDGSDLPAYANGHRDLPNGKPREHYADPDASWGHRSAISTRKGGGFYGYKVHAAVCTKTNLPLAWHVASACDSEHEHMPSLLDTAIRRGFTPGTCALDKGYDGSAMYAACESRDVRPVIPLKQTVTWSTGCTSPRRVRTASGASPGPTSSGARRSGAARPGRASPRACGSRPTGCTPSSRAPPTGGRRSTAPGSLSSVSSVSSSTSGACCRCGSVACPGFGCTWT